jgi:hypothetical protein
MAGAAAHGEHRSAPPPGGRAPAAGPVSVARPGASAPVGLDLARRPAPRRVGADGGLAWRRPRSCASPAPARRAGGYARSPARNLPGRRWSGAAVHCHRRRARGFPAAVRAPARGLRRRLSAAAGRSAGRRWFPRWKARAAGRSGPSETRRPAAQPWWRIRAYGGRGPIPWASVAALARPRPGRPVPAHRRAPEPQPPGERCAYPRPATPGAGMC